MSKTAAERSREWRKAQRANKGTVETVRDELVEILRMQIADLKEQRDAAERRCERVANAYEQHTYALRMLSERVAYVCEQVTSIASGLGGAGGVSSPVLSLPLFPEKPGESREFQDLNGRTRAHGTLQNGTRVPGTFGTEPIRKTFATKPNGIRNGTERAAADFDSEKAETELRRKPLNDAEMVAKARAEQERLEQAFGGGK